MTWSLPTLPAPSHIILPLYHQALAIIITFLTLEHTRLIPALQPLHILSFCLDHSIPRTLPSKLITGLPTQPLPTISQFYFPSLISILVIHLLGLLPITPRSSQPVKLTGTLPFLFTIVSLTPIITPGTQ